MTITPAYAAKRQWLIDRYAELLSTWGAPDPGPRARQLVDEAENLGWTPPHADGDEAIPSPSYSTKAGREAARRLFEETRAAAAAAAQKRPEPCDA
jgi:hypothetical protein